MIRLCYYFLAVKTSSFDSQCKETKYHLHVYQLNDDGPATDDWEEEDMATAKHWLLPNKEFNGTSDYLRRLSIITARIKMRVGDLG